MPQDANQASKIDFPVPSASALGMARVTSIEETRETRRDLFATIGLLGGRVFLGPVNDDCLGTEGRLHE